MSHPREAPGPQRQVRPELRAKCVFRAGNFRELLGNPERARTACRRRVSDGFDTWVQNRWPDRNLTPSAFRGSDIIGHPRTSLTHDARLIIHPIVNDPPSRRSRATVFTSNGALRARARKRRSRR